MASPHPNDHNWMGSDAQIMERLAVIRRNRGLPPDPASDRIWMDRIKSGGVEVFGTARQRIGEKAREEVRNELQHTRDLQFIHDDELVLERLAEIRQNRGLPPDPAGDQAWLGQIREGGATVFDQARLEMDQKHLRDVTDEPTDQDFGRASSIIKNMLESYDLHFDQSTIDDWVGLLSDDPNNQVVIEEQIRQSPEFAERFPGIAARTDLGLNAVSVEEYLQLENAYKGVMRAAGLPRHFYDTPQDLAEFIAHDVSPQELEHRVVQGMVAAENAPPEVRAALHDFYGIENAEGALAAYYLDPEKGLPAIEREFESAVIAGAATRTGFGSIEQDQAESLQALGISGGEAQEGFGQLAESRQVMSAGPGEVGGQRISRDQQMDAAFRGDAFARERIRRQRERRLSAFAGQDAGALQTQQGLTAGGTST